MTGASMLPPLGATQFGQTMEPPEPSAALAAKREVDRIEEEQRDAENQINFMKRKEETMKQQIKHKKKAQTQIFAVREEREKERAERIQAREEAAAFEMSLKEEVAAQRAEQKLRLAKSKEYNKAAHTRNREQIRSTLEYGKQSRLRHMEEEHMRHQSQAQSIRKANLKQRNGNVKDQFGISLSTTEAHKKAEAQRTEEFGAQTERASTTRDNAIADRGVMTERIMELQQKLNDVSSALDETVLGFRPDTSEGTE